MKVKKACFSIILLAMFFLSNIPTAHAAVDVDSCKIMATGFWPGVTPGGSGAVVFLRDNAATPRWSGNRMFYLSEGLGNAGFATLLTAYSMEKNVMVRIAGNAEAGSLISIIYLLE
jgi:hypothetical protein